MELWTSMLAGFAIGVAAASAFWIVWDARHPRVVFVVPFRVAREAPAPSETYSNN